MHVAVKLMSVSTVALGVQRCTVQPPHEADKVVAEFQLWGFAQPFEAVFAQLKHFARPH